MKQLMSRRRNQVIVILLALVILLGYYLLPRGLVLISAQGSLSEASGCTIAQTDRQGNERSVILAGEELATLLALLPDAQVQYRMQGSGSAPPEYSYTLTFIKEDGAPVGVALLDSEGYQYAGRNRYRILGEAGERLPSLLSGYFNPA